MIIPNKLDRVKNAYVLFNMRQGRGSGLIARFSTYAMFGASLKILIPTIPVKYLIFIGTPLWLIGTYYLGYLDETRIKLWQFENKKIQTHANPYFQMVEKKLNKIDKILTKLKNDKR